MRTGCVRIYQVTISAVAHPTGGEGVEFCIGGADDVIGKRIATCILQRILCLRKVYHHQRHLVLHGERKGFVGGGSGSYHQVSRGIGGIGSLIGGGRPTADDIGKETGGIRSRNCDLVLHIGVGLPRVISIVSGTEDIQRSFTIFGLPYKGVAAIGSSRGSSYEAKVVYSIYYAAVLYGIDTYLVACGELGHIVFFCSTGAGLLTCDGSIAAIGYLDGKGDAIADIVIVAKRFAITASGQQKGRGKYDDRSKQHGGCRCDIRDMGNNSFHGSFFLDPLSGDCNLKLNCIAYLIGELTAVVTSLVVTSSVVPPPHSPSVATVFTSR